MRALADHRPETLVKYALRLYDAAARGFRVYSYDNFASVLRSATEALRLAKQLGAGTDRPAFRSVATLLNDTAESLTTVLASQGQARFSFAKEDAS